MSDEPNRYERLVEASHRYLDALAAGNPGAAGFAPGARVTENCTSVQPGDGIWRTATGVRYRQVFADADAGQACVFATVDEAGTEAIFAARLVFGGGAITGAETIVAREGQASIFAPSAMTAPHRVWSELVPPEERLSREDLAAAADGYFEALETDSTRTVRFHADCQRIENGGQTTSTPRMGNLGAAEQIDRRTFVYIRAVRERRFPLIDVERGLVLAHAFLDVPGDVTHVEVDGVRRELPALMRTPRSTLLFEVFKVGATPAGPELRWIEAVMLNRPFGSASGW